MGKGSIFILYVQGCFSFLFQGAVCVEALDFEGNFMGGEGGVYFGDVLNKNTFLTDIVSVFEFFKPFSSEQAPKFTSAPFYLSSVVMFYDRKNNVSNFF